MLRDPVVFFSGTIMVKNVLDSNNNNNGYFYVLFLRRAHSPFIKII